MPKTTKSGRTRNMREVYCKSFPKNVTLIEVGPRDGFQFEEKTVPTTLKLEIIMRMVDAGFKNIQVASFVHPGKVPQMAAVLTHQIRLSISSRSIVKILEIS